MKQSRLKGLARHGQARMYWKMTVCIQITITNDFLMYCCTNMDGKVGGCYENIPNHLVR